jgi:MFS superfamily sulfate permease-like transporter
MNAPSLARMIPALGWLRAYDQSWLRSDVFAGVTLAAYFSPRVWAMRPSPICRQKPGFTRVC